MGKLKHGIIIIGWNFSLWWLKLTVREYKEHSNNLNKYQIVSVHCEGGLNDSGYSIPIKQKVYLKELGKEGTWYYLPDKNNSIN